MSIFKKFAAPLLAVALVAVMGVSLLTNTRTAYAAVGTGLVTGTAMTTTNAQIWAATALPTTGVFATSIVLTEVGTWADTNTITLTHAGYKLAGLTFTSTLTSVAVTTYSNGSTLLTITTAGNANASDDTITFTAANVGNIANTTDGAAVAAVAAGTLSFPIAAQTNKRVMLAQNTTTTSSTTVINTTVPSYGADAAAAGGAICAYVADAAGAATIGVPVTFTVSLGVVSTGSSKTAIALTNAAGTVCTNYRGSGGVAATDTAIASNSSLNLVATLSTTLTAPTGSTAAKMVVTAPTNSSVSPTISGVTPGYVSPTQQTNFAVQVQDSVGLGVNGQVLLVTVDKGILVAGFNATCGTAKAVTGTSVSQAQSPGGSAVAGSVSLTYCGNASDAAGKATITVSNITTTMANASSTISTSGRPAKVEATYANGVITAKVTDSNGNNVADGTQVQFTISSTAGAVSNACTTTSNGGASSAVSLNSGSGTVIVTASWNESGTLAAGCVAAAAVAQGGNAGAVGSIGTTLNGATGISSTVNIGSVVTPPATVAASGPGTFASAPVYSASKLAQAVFNGGTVVQLETAITATGTGAWAQDSKGVFALYIVNGGFVNDAFKAAFPTGFAGVTAVTVVGK